MHGALPLSRHRHSQSCTTRPTAPAYSCNANPVSTTPSIAADRVFLGCRCAGIPVCHACRMGSSTLAMKRVTARGEREPRPGCLDAAGVRGPGQPSARRRRATGDGRQPGLIQRTGLRLAGGPETSRSGRPVRSRVAAVQEDVAVQRIHTPPRRHAEQRGRSGRTRPEPPICPAFCRPCPDFDHAQICSFRPDRWCRLVEQRWHLVGAGAA